MKKLLWFGIAGVIGFLVDAGVLTLLLHITTIGPFLARPIAIAAAMMTTWFLNRTFTFGRSSRSVAEEGLRYGFVGTLTALLNYALYSSLLVSFPSMQPLAALVIATAAATLFSLFGYSRFVFRQSPES